MADRTESPRPAAPAGAKAVTAAAFALLYVPLLVMIMDSFMDPGAGGGFTLKWYRQAFGNETLIGALLLSLGIAAANTIGASVLGTIGAFAIERGRFPGRSLLNALIMVPLVMPELVLGLSMLIWFVILRIGLGAHSIVLAHVTFSISYVVITVRVRLQDFDRSLEDAARDLGARPSQVFWKVTFPLVWPGVLSGAMMAFTLSFDDFLITFFTAGASSDTLPLKIYSLIRFGVSPEINAISTLVFAATFALVFATMGPSKRTPPRLISA